MSIKVLEAWRNELDLYISKKGENALTDSDVISKALDLEKKMLNWDKENYDNQQ